MTTVFYAIPRAFDHGGLQRFALDTASNLSSPYRAVVRDMGTTRGEQLTRLGRLAWEARQDYALIHHWHVLSAAVPSLPVDILTCHGNEILDNRLKPLHHRALRRAKFVTANSTYTKQLVIDRFGLPESSVQVVSPPVAPNPHSAPRDTNSTVIGTLARFVPRKNLPRIIEAMRVLQASDLEKPLLFRLAGDGPMRSELLEKLDSSGVRYEYWGAISDRVKFEAFLPSLDAFVLPSLALSTDVEGFGIVYLEANAAGVPVVGARLGGAADAISEGVSGGFADPADADDIAAVALAYCRRRTTLEAPAREWAARFDVTATAARFRALYDMVTSCG